VNSSPDVEYLFIQVLRLNDLDSTKATILILLLAGGSLITTSLPLCIELAVEICYPVSEIVVTGWTTFW
jgi:hypothetical protein